MKKILMLMLAAALILSFCSAADATAVQTDQAYGESNENGAYYHPGGGRFYHADPFCETVHPDYLPLAPISREEIDSETYSYLRPCPVCGEMDWTAPVRDSANEPLATDAGESALRTLEYRYGYDGLEYLRITMNDADRRTFTLDALPPFCYLDTYHDGGDILLCHYAQMAQSLQVSDEIYGERWFMTFCYIEGDWRLTDITNGWDWTVRVDHGVYTFYDCYDMDERWRWTAEAEDRLSAFDDADMTRLIGMYNAAVPDRPSLRADEE